MPTGLESTEFLAHIDAELTPQAREAILSQVKAEIPPEASTTLHPNVPAAYQPSFSPLIEAELERKEKGLPLPDGTGIDLTRYDAGALEAPPRTTPNSDEQNPEILAQWRETLQRAYGLNTYLGGRLTNLSLLETYGKNAWLIANSQLEEILRGLERDLAELKRQAETVDEERRQRQVGAKGELEGLEESWKRGIRGIVEVELATESLRQEILARKRASAVG